MPKALKTLVVLGTLFVVSCSDDEKTGTSDAGALTDAGNDSGQADSSSSSAKGLGEGPCSSPSECESGTCFQGGTSSYCSLACTTANAATVCVAPFNGVCNNQGYCRKP